MRMITADSNSSVTAIRKESGRYEVRVDAKLHGLIVEISDNSFQYWPNAMKKHADPDDLFSSAQECLNYIA